MNLTTGKQVTASANAGTAILAVDGVAEKDEHWSAMPGPGSLTVDLERAVRLGELRLYTWWGDDWHYQYTIEVSANGKNWQKLVNASGNTEKTSPQGYRHTGKSFLHSSAIKFAPLSPRWRGEGAAFGGSVKMRSPS
jgi:hypothetical protein